MPAPVLMVQGTASAVGKSLLVTALCRIFREDGLRVAPFKAWNMALNSAVTPDGREIGRSTAAQAEAAGAEPSADMNPVLVKPEAGGRAQTVVLGRVDLALANMDPEARSAALWQAAASALDRLRMQYELIIAEGAGSPAELNLRQTDIANMRVALHAKAPVLLVGDIDCGGVFASLIGTLTLLEPEERALVRGFVINKFRGSRSHLEPGLQMLKDRTGVEVLGVLPWLPDLRLAAEDSVGLGERSAGAESGRIDIVVVRVPHIANFDDFDLLAADPRVRLRYTARPEELGNPDLVLLPGSKCTIADLEALRTSGAAARVVALARAGTPVFGVCGGFQMLGIQLLDPHGVESKIPSAPGLGLLPARTTFLPRKLTRRTRARVAARAGALGSLNGRSLDGYEIHMGVTETEAPPIFLLADEGGAERPDGCQSADGLVCGTYLHGLFENREARQALVGWLAGRRGLQGTTGREPAADVSREGEYRRLAREVRSSLDIPAVRGLVF